MVKRFSLTTFVLATLIHFSGTLLMIQESFRMLAEWKTTGVDRHPVWFAVAWWIWEPGYILFQYICHAITKHFATRAFVDPCDVYRGFILLSWSLCFGAIFGFMVPGLLRWRRQTI